MTGSIRNKLEFNGIRKFVALFSLFCAAGISIQPMNAHECVTKPQRQFHPITKGNPFCDFVDIFRGPQGPEGRPGPKGDKGDPGLPAFEPTYLLAYDLEPGVHFFTSERPYRPEFSGISEEASIEFNGEQVTFTSEGIYNISFWASPIFHKKEPTNVIIALEVNGVVVEEQVRNLLVADEIVIGHNPHDITLSKKVVDLTASFTRKFYPGDTAQVAIYKQFERSQDSTGLEAALAFAEKNPIDQDISSPLPNKAFNVIRLQ